MPPVPVSALSPRPKPMLLLVLPVLLLAGAVLALAAERTGARLLLGGALGAGGLLLAGRLGDRIVGRRDDIRDSVLHSLREGVVVADGHARIQFVNQSARDLLGADPEAWPTDDAYFLPDTVTPYPADKLPLWRALRGEELAESDVYLQRPGTGAGAWISVSGAPLRDRAGKAIGGVAILRDVTERRRAKQVVSQLLKAVEYTSDTVFVTDRDGVIQFVNPAFEVTTGYARDEAIGWTPRLLRSGRQSAAFYRQMWSRLLAGQVFRDVVVNRKKDGSLYYADQTVTPMLDDGGRVTHFVSVLKDMTEQRKRQEHEIEMQLASSIQKRFYPQEVPTVPGCDLAGAAYSAESTCGDYYDFIPMSQTRCGVVIGDVCGHGFGPALLMAETRALLRAYCQAHHDLGRVITEVNRNLVSDMEDNRFVTLLIVTVDADARRLVWVNAGHTPGYVLDAGGRVKAVLKSNGLPLGIFSERDYASSEGLAIEPGDLVLLLTDGVTECGAESEHFIDEKAVLDVVRARRHESAQDIVCAVHDAVRAFAAGRPQEDDFTIVVCKINT